MTAAVDLATAFASFEEPWAPRTIATMNDYDVRVVRTAGEFTWHSHPETDELFLVVQGSLTIRMEDGDVNTGDTPSHLTAVRRVEP